MAVQKETANLGNIVTPKALALINVLRKNSVGGQEMDMETLQEIVTITNFAMLTVLALLYALETK